MYTLATIPLLKNLDGIYNQVWFVDDAAAVGRIVDLHDWWDRICTLLLLFCKCFQDLATHQGGTP